eukprot:scaffold6771_cov158-Amphora_coffeaeformis.AAC.2
MSCPTMHLRRSMSHEKSISSSVTARPARRDIIALLSCCSSLRHWCHWRAPLVLIKHLITGALESSSVVDKAPVENNLLLSEWKSRTEICAKQLPERGIENRPIGSYPRIIPLQHLRAVVVVLVAVVVI